MGNCSSQWELLMNDSGPPEHSTTIGWGGHLPPIPQRSPNIWPDLSPSIPTWADTNHTAVMAPGDGAMDTGLESNIPQLVPVRCNCETDVTRLLENNTLPCLSPIIASFGFTLDANNIMLGVIQQICACLYTHTPPVSMSIYLLMQGVLTSCHMAWRSWCRSEDIDTSLGSCRMDDEEDRGMKRHLIRKDLKRVESLRAQLQRRMQPDPEWNTIYTFFDKAVEAEAKRLIAKLSSGTIPTISGTIPMISSQPWIATEYREGEVA